jgi:3-oxoacyl-[acyl-carrier protein] reductase
MDLGIGGRTALVTAASKGLGLGAARALAAEGCNVALNARDAVRLRTVADELPGPTLALPEDVTDPSAPARLVDATVALRQSTSRARTGGPPPAER